MIMWSEPFPAPTFHSAIAAAFAVVVERDREPRTAPQLVAEVEVGERNVHRVDDAARALVDRRRQPEADRAHAVAAQLVHDLVEHARGTPPGTRSASVARPDDRIVPVAVDRRRRRSSSRRRRHRWPVRSRGYDTPPHGAGREALPRLPRRSRQGARADPRPSPSAHRPRPRAPAAPVQGPRAEASEDASASGTGGAGSGSASPSFFVLVLVWGVASYLALRSGAQGREQAACRASREGRARPAERARCSRTRA